MTRARVILLVNFVCRRRILSKIFIRAYLEHLSIDSMQPTAYREDPTLAEKMSRAYAQGKIIGGICHGPLGLINAKKPDGSSLVKGLKMTAVTDRQVEQLGIQHTPKHPERDLRDAGALYEGKRLLFRDFFASLVVVDGNIVTGQNQKSDLEAAEKILELLEKQEDE